MVSEPATVGEHEDVKHRDKTTKQAADASQHVVLFPSPWLWTNHIMII